MLSIVDIKRELGKNIYIYPLIPSAIKSNSIDLHASRFAWSISTRKSLSGSGDLITVPPHDTALIYTQEAIYISNKIGGTYHSKVRLVSNGFGHISGSLDAQYIGLSIIAVQNISDTPKEIIVGSEFVTLSFYYLHTNDYPGTVSHDNPPGHTSLITGYEGVKEDYEKWEEQNRWCRNKSDLRMQMINSDEYKDCKKQFQQEQLLFNRKLLKKRGIKYIGLIAAWVFLNLLLVVPAYSLRLGALSRWSAAAIENFSIPLLLSLIIPNIILDRKEP